jgi:hypothetical protein
MSTPIRRAAAIWLALATLATLLVGLVYVVGQQGLRLGANDPQLQLADQAAAALDAGSAPADVLPGGEVDLARSLAAFAIVTDASGATVASNAVLDGGTPDVPAGILETARGGTTDTVTWQPREGVRIAQVTVGWRGGAVTIGRSLREVERREDVLLALCAAGLAAILLVLGAASVLVAWLVRPQPLPRSPGSREGPAA